MFILVLCHFRIKTPTLPLLQLELERVIGLTTTSPSGLSCNPTTGELAYLAGAVVVIYNVKANSQTQFLVAPRTAKAFSCIAYSSQGGKFLAAGEVFFSTSIAIVPLLTSTLDIVFYFF